MTRIQRAVPQLALLVVVLLQIGTRPSWIYTQYQHPYIDPWVYHGYFLHLRNHLTAFRGTYYGTRLAWILPGYLAHHYFGPLVANTVLRLYVYCIALFSIFAFVRRSYGVRCAILVGLLLCSDAEFLRQAGSDYVFGVGIAYMLLAIEEASAAAVRIRPDRLFDARPSGPMYRAAFAGGAFACAVHTNVFVLGLAPVVLWVMLSRSGWRGIALLAPAAAGAVIVTAFLGLVNTILGGAFLFFLPSFSTGVTLLKSNPFQFALSKWISHATWLIGPVSISVLAAAFILANRRKCRDQWVRIADAGSVIFALAMFVILTALGSPVLQLQYYACYLTIFCLIAIAGILGRSLEDWTQSRFNALAAAGVITALLAGSDLAAAFHMLPGGSAVQLMCSISILMLVALYICRRSVLAATALVIVLCGLTLIQLASFEWRQNEKFSREAYLDVTGISRQLGRLTGNEPLWFWYSWFRGIDDHYTSVAGTYLWGYRLLGLSLPDATDFAFGQLKRGAFLAMMDDSEAVLESALSVLRANGVTVRPVSRFSSAIGSARYIISLVQVERIDAAISWNPNTPAREGAMPRSEVLNYDQLQIVQHLSAPGVDRESAPDEKLPKGIYHFAPVSKHLATAFQPLDASSRAITGLKVMVTPDPEWPELGLTQMLIQDQDYRRIYANAMPINGGRPGEVALPPGTHAIRLAFLTNEKGYVRLPLRVQIEALRSP